LKESHQEALMDRDMSEAATKESWDTVMAAFEREGIHKVAFVVFGKNEKGNAFWEKCGFTSRPDLIYRNKAITA